MNTIPYYPDHIKDSYRINASLSQKFGAKVYGVGNPNISGPELDAKKLVVETGYFQIKFGMNGFQVMNTVAQQVKNIPDDVETVVGIAGSGLSMLGVAMGCKIWNKNVKTIHPVALSDYVKKIRNNHMITYHPSISLMVISMSYKVIILTNINSSWMKTYNLTKPTRQKLGIGWSRISNHLRRYCFGMLVLKNMT